MPQVDIVVSPSCILKENFMSHNTIWSKRLDICQKRRFRLTVIGRRGRAGVDLTLAAVVSTHTTRCQY